MMNIKSTLAKYDFDILALTETKVTIKNAKFMAKNVGINKSYTVFGIIDNAHINSTGIIVLVKNDIANHVTEIQDHLGRVIKIDFNFSKYNKFSIVAIYNKSGNSIHARDSRQTLNQIVINLIKEARRNQQQIIFLGDFNIRFDKYEKLKNRRVRIKNQFSIFKYLENHDFIDVHKDFLNIDDQNLLKCYSTFQNYSTFSRIDYLWITNNLYDGVVKAKIIEYDNLDTDHSLLSVRFIRNNVIFQPIRTSKNIKASRIKYLYEDLDEDSKKMIIDMTEKELDIRLKNYTPTNLDEKWNIYNHVIATIKKNYIKHKEIKIVVDKEDQNIKNTLEYRFYRYIVYIRRGLKKAKGLEQIKRNWKKIVRNLRSILKALEINVNFYILNYYFRIVLKDTYLKEIEELYSVAYISLNTEMGKIKEKKIMEAIEKRQQDLEYDQRRMIDSVMEREFKKINIDRLIVQDQDGEDVLVTDENQIKVLVANHFQNCAGSVNCEKEIPDEWTNEYKPKEDILKSVYDEVLFPITIEELIETAKMLPPKKATGPTGITYEDIKLTIEPMKGMLLEIFNDILSTGELPKDWLKAHIYPIPKPKPWQYDLNNTRPITLLETARKFFVKILTNRLSKIFTTNDILKGYQFAGLPKKSTFEPLRIVNEIINYTEQNKKEMWFLMLDMSKAYDRINIPMLENAMRRINLPEIIIKILTGLFTNRTNQVFTPFGLTDSFDMLTGIDQGEIISPLLWIIYYDPLLAKIRNTDLGFKMEAKEHIDVYENLYRLRSITFPGCAYMDDTGFITNNKNNLECILKIADSFYKLNDIKINKQKSELLLRKNISRKKPLDDIVKIKFGEDIIEVKPTPRNSNSRFLGVWISAFNDNNHVIQQIKDEISAIIKNISCRKGITDKMMIYLFNMLIIPIIEYRSQLYVIEENMLDSLMAKFRSFFKNRLKFARTAPNAILETNWIYNLNNFVANQRQAKITNFILQINDTGILGRIMEIRFLNVQQQLLLENHPLYVIDYKLIQKIRKIKNIGFKYHFILNNIRLMLENKFSIADNAGLLTEYNIEGGPTLLRDVLSDDVYIKNFNMLQENNLIFVDQITTLDKNYLLSIEEMELKRYTKLISTKRMSQEHRKSYERIIIDLSCSKISFKIKAQIHDKMLAIDEIYNLKGTVLLPTTVLPEKGATIVSRITRGPFQNRTIFGRVIKTEVDSKIIYFSHFETLTDDFEKNVILRRCEGCELGTLNAEVFKKEIKSKCLIIERIDSTFLLSPNRWNKQHHLKRLQKNTYYYEGISANFYDEALRYNYAFNNNIIEHRLDNGRMIQYDVPINEDNIDKYLAKGNRYNISNQRIKQIKDRIKIDSSNNIHVYIDGSVIDNGSENIKSIFGITIYDDKERLIDKYFSTIEQWLTSTKAETMAFFIALLLINEDKNFIVYTDSSNVIKNYKLLTNKWLSTTTRDILKFDENNALWFNIKEILDSFTQQLEVIKVKSHSDNKLHNKLDEEIRSWYNMEDRLANTLIKYNTEQYKFPIMWNGYIIEMNLRRFVRLLSRTQGLEKFLNLNRNWRYRLLDVKWEIVFSYINKQVIGETTYKTDRFISKQKRMKVQRLIEEILTIEQMKKSSYEIYQDFKCVFCYKKKEDFYHVWTCRHNRKILKQIIKRTIDKLIGLLKEYGVTFDESKILTDINKFDIFFPKFREDKFNFIDLIKGIFPKQLNDYIEKLGVVGKKNIINLGTELLQYVMDETKQHIWMPRCEKLKVIEKNHGITEKDKKRSDINIGKEKQEDILQRPINLFGRYEDLEGVKEYILFGKEILDFTVVVNRVGKI
ncbi:unnamed protein product [Rhizophagus irregularis]|nr:unnamed protein product [Rhizophagus irregularis]